MQVIHLAGLELLWEHAAPESVVETQSSFTIGMNRAMHPVMVRMCTTKPDIPPLCQTFCASLCCLQRLEHHRRIIHRSLCWLCLAEKECICRVVRAALAGATQGPGPPPQGCPSSAERSLAFAHCHRFVSAALCHQHILSAFRVSGGTLACASCQIPK